MGGSYREALAKVQSDRRYAEITASFNGLNLRSEYPSLSREEHGAIIRVAKQVLAEGAWDSDQPEVQPQPASPIAPVTPAPPQLPEAPEPALDQNPVMSYAAGALDDTSKPLIERYDPSSKRHKKTTTAGLVAIAVLAVAVYVTVRFWTSEQPPTQLPRSDDTQVDATITAEEAEVGASDTPETEATAGVAGASDTPQAVTATNVPGANDEPDVDAPVLAPSAEREIGTHSTPVVEEVGEPLAMPDVEPSLTTQTDALTEDQTAPTSDRVAVATPMEPPAELSPVTPPTEPDADAVAASAESETPETPTADVALSRQPESESDTSVTGDRVQANVATPAQTAPEETDESATSAATEIPRTPPFNSNVDPDLVRNIQRRLLAQGFDPGPIDGIMGWRTHRAIRAYQQSKGIPVDGEATELLLGSLVSYSGSRLR